MYNGLPWPDEEFSRVTVERDLKICNTMRNHPILWKLLWGLAESRPALCYCSVILRATLAVQVSNRVLLD
jgi:integrator complex subunit 5